MLRHRNYEFINVESLPGKATRFLEVTMDLQWVLGTLFGRKFSFQFLQLSNGFSLIWEIFLEFPGTSSAPQRRRETHGKQAHRKADQTFEKKLLRRLESLGENKCPFARFMDLGLSLSPAAFNVILCYAHTFFFLCYVPSKSHFSNSDRS